MFLFLEKRGGEKGEQDDTPCGLITNSTEQLMFSVSPQAASNIAHSGESLLQGLWPFVTFAVAQVSEFVTLRVCNFSNNTIAP